jgi:cytoskeletal protein CcmA (bactofilin family)
MSEPSSTKSNFTNVLSSDVSIVGSLKFTNDLVIDGNIDGEVVSDGNLTVGDKAEIKGEIRTRSVIVYGSIEGNIFVEKECVLRSTSRIQGDVSAGTLSIEAGARFSGRSLVGTPSKK